MEYPYFLDERLEEILAGCSLEVERQAAFVGIQMQEQSALLRMGFIMWEGTVTVSRITAISAFGFDHISLESRQKLRTVWTSDVMR